MMLRFLATGDSFQSMEFNWCAAHNTISMFIPEVCDAIVEEYAQEVFRTPTTTDGWREIAQGFQDKWNFPHACGALDGKHVAIRKPKHSGSIHYNYKGYSALSSWCCVMPTTRLSGLMSVPLALNLTVVYTTNPPCSRVYRMKP